MLTAVYSHKYVVKTNLYAARSSSLPQGIFTKGQKWQNKTWLQNKIKYTAKHL